MITEFEYKSIPVRIEFGTRGREHRTIYVEPEDERLRRELLPIVLWYVKSYNDRGIVPTLEEAKAFSACLCIGGNEEYGGNLLAWSPADIARESGVTEEFARFRLELERQKRIKQ